MKRTNLLRLATRGGLFFLVVLIIKSCGGGSDSLSDAPAEANSGESASSTTSEQLRESDPPVTASTHADGTAMQATSSCRASDWRSTTRYSASTLVRYAGNGRYYRALVANTGYNPMVNIRYWQQTNCSPTAGPRTASFMISAERYEAWFPNRDPFYTYNSLVVAMRSFPNMFRGPTDLVRRQELAAFFAHVKHETGGLVHRRELNRAAWPGYCYARSPYRCVSGQHYYGRGPLQLSWNYNYGPAGQALEADLLHRPDLVAQDAVLAWKVAMWFWSTQQAAATMTSQRAMATGSGFGRTIRAINGALECSKPFGSSGRANMELRVRYYRDFAARLQISPGSNLTC